MSDTDPVEEEQGKGWLLECCNVSYLRLLGRVSDGELRSRLGYLRTLLTVRTTGCRLCLGLVVTGRDMNGMRWSGVANSSHNI